MALEAVLAAVPELHDATSVEPLAGGLTNVNYKVTSAAGCFVSGGTMRLIDYEYSGNNEPSFELGNVWSESNLSLMQL